MNKTIVAVVALICVTVLIGVWIYSNSFRFVTANAGEGEVFRIDRRTGKAVLLVGDTEIPVKSPTPEPVENVTDKAIRMAKNAATMSTIRSNESVIREFLEGREGSLRIHGWSGREIDAGLVEVSFSFELNGEPYSYVFDVHTENEIVRRMDR